MSIGRSIDLQSKCEMRNHNKSNSNEIIVMVGSGFKIRSVRVSHWPPLSLFTNINTGDFIYNRGYQTP